MNYYKRHLGDYARDTGHLTALEHGVYTLLLDWYYINEKPIPQEKAERIAKGNPKETKTVLEEFFKLTPKGWIHAYADRVIQEYHVKAERNRQSGKLGGRPSKTQTVSTNNPDGGPDITLATSHKPLAITKDSIPDGIGASPDGEGIEARHEAIPMQAILGLYNATMTRLPKARELTPKRRTLIRSAWQASPKRRSIEFWECFFSECESNDFLNGTGPYRNGHENWRPDFDYLLRQETVTRVFERALDRLDRDGSEANA